MADLFHYTCRACTRAFHLGDDRPDTDEAKIARMYCLWCKSTDIHVEPLNDVYFEKHPELGRPKEGKGSYPLDMQFDEFLESFDPLGPSN